MSRTLQIESEMPQSSVNTVGQLGVTVRTNKRLLNKTYGVAKRAPFLCRKPKRSDSGKILVRSKRLIPPVSLKIIASGGTAIAVERTNAAAAALRSDAFKEKRGAPALVSISSNAKSLLDLYSVALGCSLLSRANSVRCELSTLGRVNSSHAEVAVAALARELAGGDGNPIYVPTPPPARTAAEEEADEAEEEADAEAEEEAEEAALEKVEAADAAAPDEEMEEEEEAVEEEVEEAE